MEKMLSSLADLCVNAGSKLILAVLVYFIGKSVISTVTKTIKKTKGFASLDETVSTFALSALKGVLYVVLVVSIIGILGVPMASVVTVLASGGLAVGMSLQGALSNLAGGIMLMVFKPFKVGDYITGGGAEGSVKEVTMFYTVLTTVDNKRITVPNGTLMNANITNCSAEATRRVDLDFSCAKSEAQDKIINLLQGVMMADEKVMKDPAPFARLSGGTDTSAVYTIRAWVKSEDYWDVYFDLKQGVADAFAYNNVQAPAVRVLNETVTK